MDKSTILIVDDNEAVRDLLTIRLRDRGYLVHTAVNGFDALTMLQQVPFDLVLLDIMMPKMNGYEVLENLRQYDKFAHLPVIVLSAINDMSSVVKCVELGAEDYLFKPINSSLLWARITASLERKHFRDKEQLFLKELATLHQVDQELNSSLDITEVANIALRNALRQTRADGGFFATLADDLWQVRATSGITKQLDELLPFSVFGANDAAENGRVYHYQIEQGTELIDGAYTRLFVPIRRENVVHGLIVLEKHQDFEGRTFDFLARLSDHVSIALNNAQLYAAIQAADRAKTDFVAMVSHELKTPLTAILAYGDLLTRKASGPLTERQETYLTALQEGAQRMNNLVVELDDVTRMETGQFKLELDSVILQEVVDEALRLLNQEIATRNQTISVEIAPDLPLLWADRKRLSQIVVNLLSNASKYMPEGGHFKLCAQLTGEDAETAVQIAIVDNGIGISAADQARIFSQFFRSEDAQVRAIRGAGLGLNITKKIVELHGGEIWFQSEYGQGTTFYFTIPVVETAVTETISG